SDDGVRAAYDYSVAVARHMDRLRSRVAEAEEYVRQKQFQMDQIAEERKRALADLGMSGWADDLNSLKDAIARYRLALGSLWPAVESLQEARRACQSGWTHVEQATAREKRQKDISNQLEQRAIASEIRRDAARRVPDGGLDEIVQRVARA